MSTDRARTMTWRDPLSTAVGACERTGIAFPRPILDGTRPPAPLRAPQGCDLVAAAEEEGGACFRPKEPRAACLDEAEILRLLEGKLLESERVEIEAHMDGCEPCRHLVGAVAQTEGTLNRGPDPTTHIPSDGSARVLGHGAAIGRYRVLSLLGEGGMSTVYAAYDPHLDRRIAIKLLRTVGGSTLSRAVLMREARALGKLSHPNVVQVYDAGEHEGDVFLAMELVEGRSLQAWCRTLPRPGWREVVAAYVDVAHGLSAAHAKGIVHRDVKPSNLLRGDDGRARVADFGVAAVRTTDHAARADGAGAAVDEGAPFVQRGPASGRTPRAPAGPATAAPEEVAGSVGVSSEDALPTKRAMLGTPLYMAPEQHEGARATAASDQYSFCLALYEGLYVRPPFIPKRRDRREGVLDALLVLKKAGLPPSPPPNSSAPAWVYEAIVRGLAPDPGHRHPSMDALIAALDVERTEQRERELRLRTLERDQDHTVGARSRFVVLSLLALFSATLSLLGWGNPRLASIGHLIVDILVLNGMLWVAIGVWHRQLLASQMGRMATGSTAVVGLAILANRLIALRLGTPVSHVLMVDMGLMGEILAFAGILVQGFRRTGIALAVTSAAGVVLTLARPELAVPAASWASIIALAGLSYTAYRHAARR